MAVFSAGIFDLVLLVFLVLAFAEYAKVRQKSKGFNWLAGAGLLFLTAGAFMPAHLDFWDSVPGAITGQWLFEFAGWVFLVVGALVVVMDLTKTKK